MHLRGSHLVSLAILAGIAGWMFTGSLIQGGQANPDAETIAQREAKRKTEAFRVRVKDVMPDERVTRLSIRGRTVAEALVSVRAETGGTVEKRLVTKGQTVKKGDMLCIIDKGVRQAGLDQMKARLDQAKRDYDANKKLLKRGFTTKAKLRAIKSELDAAEAALAQQEQDIQRTSVRATVDGQVHEPLAEAGDNLSPGGICATLIDSDPMMFSGQVPEREIGNLQPGMEADVELISGENVKGKIRYISPVADAKTRTFEIEIELPNPDGKLRDGQTATASVELNPTSAYQIEASWLVLADDGKIGLRTVSPDNVANFLPVQIIAQDEKGVWVDGLQPGTRVITLGQNFINAGEPVVPVTDAEMKAMQADEKAKAEAEAAASKKEYKSGSES